MKALLFNADGTPAVVEASETEKLMALTLGAFAMLSGIQKREQATIDRWLTMAVQTLGEDVLARHFPGLKIHKAQGGIH